jgi:cytidyltransferase-like protein
MNKIEILQKLQTIQKEITQFGFKCWLDFGQLLGAKREGRLLDWDDDIDFGILLDDRNKIKIIENIISRHLGKKVYPFNNFAFLRYNIEGFIVDFFFYYQKEKWLHSQFSMTGGINMRSFFFDELEEIDLDGVRFDCPRHLELFLKIRYGETWETPIKKSYASVKQNPGHIYQFKNFHCLTSGVFDLLHEGHIKLFERAKKEFDILTIGIHSDEVVSSYKRTPIDNMEERYEKIMKLGIADFVIKDFPLIANESVLDNYDFILFGKEDNNKMFYPFEIKNHSVERTNNISTTMILQTEFQ